MSYLSRDDPNVADIIDREGTRIENTIDLVAAENHCPRSHMEALGSVFNMKAAEGYPGNRFHAGCIYADELEALAKQCTEQEDAANKVERQVGKSAAALLLRSRIGKRFDALVTGASSKGTWVRLLSVPVEGKLVQGFEGVDVGDRMRVQLIGIDVERGYIDFKRVGSSRRG